MIELEDRSQRPATVEELRGYLSENAEEFLSAYRNLSSPGADTLAHAPPYVVAMGTYWLAYWQNERDWSVRRFIELLCEGLVPLQPRQQRKCLDEIAAGAREIVGDKQAERTIAEDGNPLPATPVTLDWAMDHATDIIVDAEDPKVPRFVDADPLSPSLVDAYLAWRRVKTVISYVEGVLRELPVSDEEEALCEFTNATSHVEQKHREAVLSDPAPTGADKLLKLRCLLEYDRDIFDERGGEIAPDLAHLAMLVTIPEPDVVEHPEMDDDRRDFLTARPDAIPHQPPADLLRLFTPEEGAEIFALAAGYRTAKETGSASLPDLIESLEAYGLYAAWHGGYKMVAPNYVPGLILTGEERRELGELGRLSTATVERLDAASSAREAEAEERKKQTEAEKKAKQAAEDRAKHGPPTSERLIPLLPSFSEEAREAASSILISADMMSTIHGMVTERAAVLQTQQLEELRRFDITTLKDRFQAETQDILREELDRLIRRRRAEVAS